MQFHLHITLAEIYTPNVWRRVSVPANFTFHKLHKVIQRAFGWKDYHLFQFTEFERSSAPSFNIGIPDAEDLNPVSDASKVKLSQVLPHHTKLKYIYDFGDHWEHVITLEKTTDELIRNAILLGGEGACPPEDCGGAVGYEHVKVVLGDPQHDEYEDIRTWIGLKKNQHWQSDVFDIEKAATRVTKV